MALTCALGHAPPVPLLVFSGRALTPSQVVRRIWASAPGTFAPCVPSPPRSRVASCCSVGPWGLALPRARLQLLAPFPGARFPRKITAER